MSNIETNGIVIGIVTDLNDDENLGRVKVQFPHLENQESDWARMASLMAGGGRGAFFRPEKGDEVLVGFEHGDPRRPYILGAVWSRKDPPPEDDGQKVQNNWRFIQSRSGHIVKLDDTQGKEKIEILSKGGHQVRLDDNPSGEKIEIIAKGGEKIIIDTTGKQIQIICSTGKVSIEATNIDIKASATMNLEASASMSLKAPNLTVDASGILTLKGSLVKIN